MNLMTTETQPIALVGGGLRAVGELKAGDRVLRWDGREGVAVTVQSVPGARSRCSTSSWAPRRFSLAAASSSAASRHRPRHPSEQRELRPSFLPPARGSKI
jgi:hypothetical protein